MGGSSIRSKKRPTVFPGTDPEYSVEEYSSAVTAKFIVNIGLEPLNTPLQQNWIHRRTALLHTTLDGAAQNCFSVLTVEIKPDWKRFTESSTLNETNNIRGSSATKFLHFRTKQ